LAWRSPATSPPSGQWLTTRRDQLSPDEHPALPPEQNLRCPVGALDDTARIQTDVTDRRELEQVLILRPRALELLVDGSQPSVLLLELMFGGSQLLVLRLELHLVQLEVLDQTSRV
jgi:hypothetical protein